MAHAQAQIETTYKIHSVTLTLNEEEVRTLLVVLSLIGGSPDNSPRKHADSIDAALQQAIEANVLTYSMTREYTCVDDRYRSIYFNNYPKDVL